MRLYGLATASLLAVSLLSAPLMAQECTVATMIARPDAAIAPCIEALQQPNLSDARKAELLYIRGRAYHRMKRYEHAAADYSASDKLDGKNAELLVSWSILDLHTRDAKGYVEKLERAYTIAPTSARVIRAVGLMYDNFGDKSRALELYGKALEINPAEPFALLFRFNALRATGKFEEALADANRLVEVPTEAGNQDGYLDEAGRIRDFHISMLIKRAALLESVGQLDRASSDYEAAVDAGRTAPALVGRAEFLLNQKDDFAQAVELLEEATKKEPFNATAQSSLGIAFWRSGQPQKAYDAFDRAVSASPKYGFALLMRAKMHREFGRTDEAVSDLTSALIASPYLVSQTIAALQRAGYWGPSNPPEELTPAFADALRACMLDKTCN
jgi:tetratricopeptide (TPR) repeat protein